MDLYGLSRSDSSKLPVVKVTITKESAKKEKLQYRLRAFDTNANNEAKISLMENFDNLEYLVISVKSIEGGGMELWTRRKLGDGKHICL